MEELRAFIKGLGTDDAREAFAATCGTSLGHLRNVYCGLRPLSPETCVAVEAETGGKVRRWHLRPADWFRIWPELKGRKGAPVVPAQTAKA